MAYLSLGPRWRRTQALHSGWLRRQRGRRHVDEVQCEPGALHAGSWDHENWRFMLLASVLYQNGTLFLYFDLQQVSKTIDVTDVFMATHSGLLSS
jgi:hypothetical protein